MPVVAASSIVEGSVSRGHVDAGCSGELDRERESWTEEQTIGISSLVVGIANVELSGSLSLSRAEC